MAAAVEVDFELLVELLALWLDELLLDFPADCATIATGASSSTIPNAVRNILVVFIFEWALPPESRDILSHKQSCFRSAECPTSGAGVV